MTFLSFEEGEKGECDDFVEFCFAPFLRPFFFFSPTSFSYSSSSSITVTFGAIQNKKSKMAWVDSVVPLRLEDQIAMLKQDLSKSQRHCADLQRELDAAKALIQEKSLQGKMLEALSGEKIVLDVGGVRMSTTLKTLTQGRAEGSLLAKRFSQQGGHMGLEADEDGSHFLDRDPSSFALLLTWLRTGECPHDVEKRRALLMEAEFFKVVFICFLEIRVLDPFFLCMNLLSDYFL